MPAYIFHAPKWRQLPGNSIVKGGKAYPMDADDRIVFRGRGYHLGSPEPAEPDPVDCMTHHQSAEEPALPSASKQSRTYVTVTGAGDRSGRDWANACQITDLYDRLLSCGPGAQAYVAAGDYQVGDSIGLPDNAEVYGGFDSASPTWATRDAFSHPTRLVYNRRVPAFVCNSGHDYVIDGISIRGCAGMISGARGQYRMRTLNCTAVDCVSEGDPILSNPQHCYVSDCRVTEGMAVLLASGYPMTDCKVLGCVLVNKTAHTDTKTGMLVGDMGTVAFDERCPENAAADISDCMVSGCSMESVCGAYDSRNLAGIIVGGGLYACPSAETHCLIRDCTVTACDCRLTDYGHAGIIVSGTGHVPAGDRPAWEHDAEAWIHGCDVIDCTIEATGREVADIPATDEEYPTQAGILTAAHISYETDLYGADVLAAITGCRMINCSATLSKCRLMGLANAVALDMGNRGEATVSVRTRICNCLDVCCSSDFTRGTYGKLTAAYVAWSKDSGRYGSSNADRICYISSIQGDYLHGPVLPIQDAYGDELECSDSLAWQTQTPDGHFDLSDSTYHTPATMASSIHQDKLGVYLGIGNSIADFKDTGLADLNEGACYGRQDLTRCPAPWTPEYAGWLAVMGDWRPLDTSQLAGKAAQYPHTVRDLAGVTRPGKATIGAYETV